MSVALKKVQQAGAIVFRNINDPQILIVRAKQDPSQWIFPKGHVEPGESKPEAALREAKEEAGVIGEIVTPVYPIVEFPKNGLLISVQYFLTKLTAEVRPKEDREKKWVSPDEARRLLYHDGSRRVLESALAHLAI